jgi:hypothetical protein
VEACVISKLKFLVVGIYFMLEKGTQLLFNHHDIKTSRKGSGIYKNLHCMDCSARRVTRRSSGSKAFMIDHSITLRLPPVINIIPSHLEKSQWTVMYKIHNDCDFPRVLNEHHWSRWCERRWCVRSLHSQFPWRSRW